VLTRQRLDRQRLCADDWQRAVHVSVGAQNVGQHGGVAGIGLPACLAVSLPITRDRPRIDRVDGEPGTGQRHDQQVLVGLDRNRCVRRSAAVLGDQLHDGSKASDVGADPCSGDDLAVVVDQRDVMVGLGPVDSAADTHWLLLG